jgi:hypothetical protein
MVRIIEKFLTPFEQNIIKTVCSKSSRSVPSWLGTFQFNTYYKKSYKRLIGIGDIATRLESLVPEQEFNTAFLQKYEKGAVVSRHRDPRNNIGFTIIAIAGEFTGATTSVYLPEGKKEFTLQAGDVCILPCTIDGKQGPPHEVSSVLTGTRNALILNTIL